MCFFVGTDSHFSTPSDYYKWTYIVRFENLCLSVDITGDYATELAENQGTDVDCHCQTFQPNLVPTSAVDQVHGDFNTLNEGIKEDVNCVDEKNELEGEHVIA